MKNVLITGGTGIIGRELSNKLLAQSYQVKIVSRKKIKSENTRFSYFCWDPDRNYIDINALADTDYIIHLAGENISLKRWTNKQKKRIESSRIKTTELIYRTCLANGIWPKAFISSSATGYYGAQTSEKIFSEDDLSGNDYLADVCKKWEAATDLFSQANIRTVKIRTGVVLSKFGGIYPKLEKLSRKYLSAAIGNGNQYIPWIHIEDIANIYLKAVKDEKMQGIYNGVAPQHLRNKELVEYIAKNIKRKVILPNIPTFVLKMIFGAMSCVLLEGSRVSSDKIQLQNYEFLYPEIKKALHSLIND